MDVQKPSNTEPVHLNEDLQYLLMNIETTNKFSKELWSVMLNEYQKILPACGEQTQFSQGGGTVHWHGSLQNSTSKDVKYN